MASSMIILASVLSTVCLLWLINKVNSSVVKEQSWQLQFITGFAISRHVFTASASTVSACGSLCTGFSGCKSFGFNSGSHTCWLYDHLVLYTTNGAAAPGTRYFWRLSPRCPTELGYILGEDLCFKVHRVNMKFHEARDVCAGEGGTLFIADTAAKVDRLQNDLTHRAWVGASDAEVEGDWRWEDGGRLDINSPLWNPDQPDNYNGIEHALVVETTGGVNDNNPGQKIHAACQLPLL